LANKLQTVGALLQTPTESPAIHNNEYKRADIVINSRQHSSSGLTNFYMWLDKNGKISKIQGNRPKLQTILYYPKRYSYSNKKVVAGKY
jgi:hypothetical protein